MKRIQILCNTGVDCLPSNPLGKLNDIPLLPPFVVHHTPIHPTYHLIESICEIYLIIYQKEEAHTREWMACKLNVSQRNVSICDSKRRDKPSDKFNLDLISSPQFLFDQNLDRSIKWMGFSMVYCRTFISPYPYFLGTKIAESHFVIRK